MFTIRSNRIAFQSIFIGRYGNSSKFAIIKHYFLHYFHWSTFVICELWKFTKSVQLTDCPWQFRSKWENIGKNSFNFIKNCKFDINKLEKKWNEKETVKNICYSEYSFDDQWKKNTHKSTINSSCYAYLQNWLQWIGLNWIQVIFGEIFPFIEI